jgi:hypothetical protein
MGRSEWEKGDGEQKLEGAWRGQKKNTLHEALGANTMYGENGENW